MTSRLTLREYQVLTGLALGMSNVALGRRLYLSEATIKSHAQQLFRKLGAANRAHAVALGFRRGLLSLFPVGPRHPEGGPGGGALLALAESSSRAIGEARLNSAIRGHSRDSQGRLSMGADHDGTV